MKLGVPETHVSPLGSVDFAVDLFLPGTKKNLILLSSKRLKGNVPS